MNNLNGTYKGFSATDESGIALGELEIIVDDETVSFRFATGLEVASDEAPRSLLRKMSTDEVAALFEPDADVATVTAHMLGDDGAILLFLDKVEEDPGAYHTLLLRFVSSEIDAIFGPTILFTPEQVEAGYFDKALEALENAQGDPGVVPRIANNGHRG